MAELKDHERAHNGTPGFKVRHGADALGRVPKIVDRESLNHALNNAEGDDEINRIKSHMAKRGYDTSSF